MQDAKEQKIMLENREALLLEALENIRQRALDLLYRTDKSPHEIIREAADEELLELETRQGRTRLA